MRYWQLIKLFFRLGTMHELEYRENFFMQVVQSTIALSTALVGLWVIFSHTSSLANWQFDELLVLLALYFLIGGLINLIVRPSMKLFMDEVWDGNLDFTLTKPENLQFLISLRQVAIWYVFDVLLGLGVLLVALVRLSATIGLFQALGFTVTLFAGAIILYSFWLILSTCAFWTVRLENIILIFQSMYDAGRWPVGLYPGWLRLSLTFVVPVAFAITFPAEALIGRLGWVTVAGAVTLAIVQFIFASWFWRFGVKHYTGASA